MRTVVIGASSGLGRCIGIGLAQQEILTNLGLDWDTVVDLKVRGVVA